MTGRARGRGLGPRRSGAVPRGRGLGPRRSGAVPRGRGLGPRRSDDVPLVGVLALQGGFEAHARALEDLGAEAREVRVPADLDGLDALVMPGGESTTMSLGVEREALGGPLRDFVGSGRPVLGTCAGMILLDRDHLDLLDVRVRRNAFGRQTASFEADLEMPDGPLRAVFIRAPWVEEAGEGVQVLARVDGHPVAVRQANILAVAFHPELTDDRRLHRWLLDRVREP